MKNRIRSHVVRGQRRILERLARHRSESGARPMLGGQRRHYEASCRTRAIGAGGIGAMHMVAKRSGLIREIDNRVELLKAHAPYHESDHVLNLAYNVLCGGRCLEDIEIRRNDEAFLDALGAVCIPDPTTAGDFCRRFDESQIHALMTAINEARLRVWRQQPEDFFEEAIIDADGTMVETTGECKEGMDVDYKGRWGYQALMVSLANTSEPLYLVNRSGNRPSSEGAAEYLDRAIALVRRAGFRKARLRGDTDFSQSQHLDRWDEEGVRFVFGYGAQRNMVEKADGLAESKWRRLTRPPKYEVKTTPRARPENVKKEVVKRREFKNVKLQSEDVAEFDYSPAACKKHYRVVVVRKNLTVEKGEIALFDDIRYFFYITNDRELPIHEVVLQANRRCDQEKIFDELKNEVCSLRAPVDNLLSNWAYMVMVSIAWSLKAWFALMMPVSPRWQERHVAAKTKVLRMSFRCFVNGIILMPAQIVSTGRRLIYRLLSWTPWQSDFFRAVDVLARPLRC